VRNYFRALIFLHIFLVNFYAQRILIAVCSVLRTNFAEMPGNRRQPGSLENKGRRGGESESPEEEAIEIGNG
jgi:hypothetical protein